MKTKKPNKLAILTQALELAKHGMYGVANAPNGTGRRSFIGTPYKAAAKSGTAQVFSYETYNASKLAEHLRDHKLMIAYAPYDKPTIAVAIILENGGVAQQSVILCANI